MDSPSVWPDDVVEAVAQKLNDKLDLSSGECRVFAATVINALEPHILTRITAAEIAAYERAAKVAENAPDVFWERPDGRPTSLPASKEHIAAAIRALKGGP